MRKRSSFERLAIPMFVSGLLAMLASAFISLGGVANANNAIQFKKVNLTYLSSGYSATDTNCGSAQDYFGSWNMPSFRAKYSSSESNQKTFLCTSTFYVVSDIQIPTPKPVPTVTIIYKPTSAPTRSPSPSPTKTTRPTPIPTRIPLPTPTSTPIFTQKPTPTFPFTPTTAPTRPPRH
jgi:hypothetical protein